MKQQYLLFFTLFCTTIFAQQKQTIIKEINDQVEIIDSYSEADEFSLDPEEFLDHIADHGAVLNGYYEHDRLKKIVKRIGYPSAMVVTSYYFWNGQLVFVNYKHEEYDMIQDEDGQYIVDYSSTITRSESTLYYHKGKQISFERVGTPLKEIPLEKGFVNYSKRMKALLDNKFSNKETYKKLQGSWVNVYVPDEKVVFEETIRFNFREGKFLNRQKMKIKDNVMYCSSPKSKYIYKYKIESISNDKLILKDLQDVASEPDLYIKEE